MAVDYIAAKFGNVGLMPYGDNATYLQPFHFQVEPRLGELNTLQIGRKRIPQGDARGSRWPSQAMEPCVASCSRWATGSWLRTSTSQTTRIRRLQGSGGGDLREFTGWGPIRTASTWPTTICKRVPNSQPIMEQLVCSSITMIPPHPLRNRGSLRK